MTAVPPARAVALVALVGALGLASLAVAAGARAETAVSITRRAYLPSSVVTSAGSTVTWTNLDSTNHSVTSDEPLFDSSPTCGFTGLRCLGPGERFAVTFNQPGTFNYHCKVHPSMRGTVTVTGGAFGGSPFSSPSPTVGAALEDLAPPPTEPPVPTITIPHPPAAADPGPLVPVETTIPVPVPTSAPPLVVGPFEAAGAGAGRVAEDERAGRRRALLAAVFAVTAAIGWLGSSMARQRLRRTAGPAGPAAGRG